MKLYIYLVISVLAHLILLSLLSNTHFSQEAAPPVFNVDIVAPLEPVKETPIETPPPVVLKKRPLQRHERPSPPVPGVMPENMYGEGDSKTVLQKDPETEAIEEAETGSEAETPDETVSLKKHEEGFFLARESSLYDKSKIKKMSGKFQGKRKVIPFNTSDLKYRGFMSQLREQIESIWQYPEKSARLGVSGDLRIRFVINRDGTLGDVELIRPSGYRELDDAAIKAIRDSFPFWPLPDDWEGDEYEVDGHFAYVLGGVYVR